MGADGGTKANLGIQLYTLREAFLSSGMPVNLTG